MAADTQFLSVSPRSTGLAASQRGVAMLPRRSSLPILAALPGLIMAGRVDAQTEALSGEIEMVTVTAQRREENLQSVPISITALDGAALTNFAIQTTEDLNVVIPSLDVARFRASATPFMRGIGNPDTGAGNEASVALYVDGIYIASQAAALFGLVDVDRVEVLRGPQGTLFGRNAVGGLIHIVTRQPSSEPALEAEIAYGSHDTFEGNFYGSTGFTEALSTSLAVLYRDQDEGFGRNIPTGLDVNKQRQVAARNKWVLDLGSTEVTFAADYSETTGSMGLSRALLPGAIGLDGVSRFLGSIHDTNWNINPEWKNEQFGGSLQVRHDFGWAEIVSRTAVRDTESSAASDQDLTPRNLTNAYWTEVSRNWQQEFQLSSSSTDRFQWIAGAFFYHDESGYDEFRIEGDAIAPLASIDTVNEMTTQSAALFGQGSYRVSPLTNLTLGLRYTIDERELEGAQIINGVVARTGSTGEASWSEPTWRLAIDRKLGDNALGYVSYSRGFKGGVFNTISTINGTPVDPEILDAVEAGLKWDLMDHTLRVNAAAFAYDHKDIQLTQQLRANQTLLLNAAEARIYGAEIELQKIITDRLQVKAAATWLDTEYTSFPGAPASIPRPTGGNAVTFTDASGNHTIRAPKYTASLFLDYAVPVGAGNLTLSGGYYYNDGFYWEGNNRLRQPSYGLVNATIKWSITEDFGLKLWGRNLRDEQYYMTISGAGFGDLGSSAPPRTYGISFFFHM